MKQREHNRRYREKLKKDPERYKAQLERNRASHARWLEKNPGVEKFCRIRYKVLLRDSFTCQYCGRKPPDVVLHVDHIIPRSKGGSNSIENLSTACADCNLGKGDILDL